MRSPRSHDRSYPASDRKSGSRRPCGGATAASVTGGSQDAVESAEREHAAEPDKEPQIAGPRGSLGTGRPGTRGCRWSCRSSWRCAPRPGSAGSTTRGTGRSRRASPGACPSSGPGGFAAGAVAVVRRGRTSRRTTPRRCRSCCAGRSRWVRRRRRAPCRETRRRRCRRPGNSPWNTFMRCAPSGSSSSPHGNACPAQPAARGVLPLGLGRQARARPRRSTRAASCHETWTHGMVAAAVEVRLRPLGVAPVGALDLAPPRCLGDGARVGGKSSGSRPPKTNDQPKRSASVTCPVASTNAANSSLRHGVDADLEGDRARRCAPAPRRRPDRPSGRRDPMRKRPRGIATSSGAGPRDDPPLVTASAPRRPARGRASNTLLPSSPSHHRKFVTARPRPLRTIASAPGPSAIASSRPSSAYSSPGTTPRRCQWPNSSAHPSSSS